MDYLKNARESVAMYETVGDEDLIEIQQLLTVIMSNKKATPELMGQIAGHGIHSLIDMSVQELELFGLTHYDALKIHASLILAKKLAKQTKSLSLDITVRSPGDLADYLMPKMRHLKKEHFVVFYLNTKNKVIKEKTVFVGTLNASIVHPREVLSEAVKIGCASIIVAHNHPSGDPEPSQEDISISRRLVESSKIIGIELLDHLVVGDNTYVSIKQKGYL